MRAIDPKSLRLSIPAFLAIGMMVEAFRQMAMVA